MTTATKPGVTAFATPNDREVEFTRVLDAPRRLVFDAWTQPKHIQQWMLGPEGWTMPECAIDLRVGGSWRYVWRNTLRLTESGGRTTATLTVTYPSKDARDAALKTGMKEGMDPSFARLEELLRKLK
jgi:uncharacterized protein YndB with AHSA1/START domain